MSFLLAAAIALTGVSPALLLGGRVEDGGIGARSAMPVGIFENQGDIGTVLHPGSAQYDPASKLPVA